MLQNNIYISWRMMILLRSRDINMYRICFSVLKNQQSRIMDMWK